MATKPTAKKKPNKELDATREAMWRIARARWEGEAKTSFADLTSILNITKQAIGVRARKDGWQKKESAGPTQAQVMTAKAHVEADRRMAAEPASPSEETGGVDGLPSSKPARPSISVRDAGSPDQLAAAVEAAGVLTRADVITRHRSEWNAVRNLAYKALKAHDKKGDPEMAKTAKAVSETIRNVQEGERKAWGIEGGEEKPALVVVRQEGAQSVRKG